MSEGHASTTKERREIWTQIQDARIGFLTTSAHDGHLRARPLQSMSIMGAALTHTPPNYEGEHKTFTV